MPLTNDVPTNLTSRQYVDILLKQKNFIFVFTLSAILTALALTYVVSEKYIATVTIVYRPQEASLLRPKETEAFGAPVPAPPFKVISHTLKKLINSEAILQPVVQDLHLEIEAKKVYPTWYQRWYHGLKDYVSDKVADTWMLLKFGRIIKEDPIQKAVEKLGQNIDIKTTEDSYVYLLQVKDKYPDRAAQIVDAAGSHLVALLQSQHQKPSLQRSMQLYQQLSQKENEIKGLRDQREKLLKHYRNISIAEETSAGVDTLYSLKMERDQLNAKIAEKEQKVSTLKEEKQQMLKKGYIHPDDLKRLESEELFENIGLQALKAKKTSYNSSISTLDNKLQNLVTLETELKNLDMRVDTNTREYVQIKDMYIEAFAKASALSSEIRVLNPAVIPAKPAQPIKIYHIGLTALLALSVSLGLVFVLAFFNIHAFFVSKGIRRHLPEPEVLGYSPQQLLFTSLRINGGLHQSKAVKEE